MSKRRLKPDEIDLWQQIARSADPLHPGRKMPVERPQPKPKSTTQPDTLPDLLPRFSIGQSAKSSGYTPPVPPTTTERLGNDPVQMDAKAFGRMKRGKLVPEDRIDLHGLTVDQAHPALARFILTSQSRGLRLVLVITGKGQREDVYDPMPRRRGVLKSQVPQWLRMPPVSQAILQITEAHQRHGGGGAYYVYLRRRR